MLPLTYDAYPALAEQPYVHPGTSHLFHADPLAHSASAGTQLLNAGFAYDAYPTQHAPDDLVEVQGIYAVADPAPPAHLDRIATFLSSEIEGTDGVREAAQVALALGDGAAVAGPAFPGDPTHKLLEALIEGARGARMPRKTSAAIWKRAGKNGEAVDDAGTAAGIDPNGPLGMECAQAASSGAFAQALLEHALAVDGAPPAWLTRLDLAAVVGAPHVAGNAPVRSALLLELFRAVGFAKSPARKARAHELIEAALRHAPANAHDVTVVLKASLDRLVPAELLRRADARAAPRSETAAAYEVGAGSNTESVEAEYRILGTKASLRRLHARYPDLDVKGELGLFKAHLHSVKRQLDEGSFDPRWQPILTRDTRTGAREIDNALEAFDAVEAGFYDPRVGWSDESLALALRARRDVDDLAAQESALMGFVTGTAYGMEVNAKTGEVAHICGNGFAQNWLEHLEGHDPDVRIGNQAAEELAGEVSSAFTETFEDEGLDVSQLAHALVEFEAASKLRAVALWESDPDGNTQRLATLLDQYLDSVWPEAKDERARLKSTHPSFTTSDVPRTVIPTDGA